MREDGQVIEVGHGSMIAAGRGDGKPRRCRAGLVAGRCGAVPSERVGAAVR